MPGLAFERAYFDRFEPMIPLIAAGIAAAASVGGAYLSSRAQKKAAKTAAKTSAANNSANNALARENRNFAYGVLSPYRAQGMAAGNALSGMLLGTPTASALGQSSQGWREGPVSSPTDPVWAEGALPAMGLGSRGDPVRTLQGHLAGEIEGPMQDYRTQAYERYSASNPSSTSPAVTPALSTAAPVQSPWDQFRESTNYKFRFDEGMNALNHGLAFSGLGDSGAGVKAAMKYGQNFASNELGNYMNLLAQQQQMGMSATSAMVGVGNNATGQIIANNNQGSTDQANAALIRGNAQGQMWSGIAQGIGQIAGAVGSSYGRPSASISAPTTGGYSPYSIRGIPSMPGY